MSASNGTSGTGPWPEPDAVDVRTEVEPAGPSAPWAPPENGAEPRGSKGAAIAVAGLNVGVLVMLPVLLVIGIYTFLTVYAIVKAVGSGSDAASPTVVLLGVVGLVTLFTLLLGVGGWAIGRAADPKKRRS